MLANAGDGLLGGSSVTWWTDSSPNSSIDLISAQITGFSAPIRGPWTIACIDIGSMDGISAKNAEEIVHGPVICTEGRTICTDIGSMYDSGAAARTDIGPMDGLGAAARTDTESMDDSGARADISPSKLFKSFSFSTAMHLLVVPQKTPHPTSSVPGSRSC